MDVPVERFNGRNVKKKSLAARVVVGVIHQQFLYYVFAGEIL